MLIMRIDSMFATNVPIHSQVVIIKCIKYFNDPIKKYVFK